MLTSRQMASTLPFYIPEDDPPAKRQILRAAMKLFSERGLDGTSIRDIARESGFTNPALFPTWMEFTPMNRVATADEIAAIILFLASPASSVMTGAVVVADAGYTIW